MKQEFFIQVEGKPLGKRPHDDFESANHEAIRLMRKENADVHVFQRIGTHTNQIVIDNPNPPNPDHPEIGCMTNNNLAENQELLDKLMSEGSSHTPPPTPMTQGLVPIPPRGFIRYMGTDFAKEKLPDGSMFWCYDSFQWRPSVWVGCIVPESDHTRYYACPDGSQGPDSIQVGGSHYKGLSIQPAEFIEKNKLSFLEGCVIKRMCRHRSKNKIEDLRKAIHEIQLLAKYEYGIDNLTP